MFAAADDGVCECALLVRLPKERSEMLTGQSRTSIRLLAVLALSTAAVMLGGVSEASAHWLSGRAAKNYAQSLAQEAVRAVRAGRLRRHYVHYALLLKGMAYEPLNDRASFAPTVLSATWREFDYRCGQDIIIRVAIVRQSAKSRHGRLTSIEYTSLNRRLRRNARWSSNWTR